ncbi:MAG: aspartate aminotransferase family protein [Clostridiaceae bacterium]|nr:aspartate aminotransferase family protein [Clostridiaceae bacterium]
MENYDILQPVTHTKKLNLVSGSGAQLKDIEGKTYLDFNEICVVLGQNNEHFINRVTTGLHGVTSGKSGYSPDKEKLYSFLMETTGHKYNAIHLTSSGSETTEWAVKTALKMTGKTEVLSFWNSIHGRTHLSASMSGLPKRKTHYGPIAPGIVFSPYPDCSHCPFEKECGSCGFFCLRFLDNKVAYESANDIGAVIVEPYQGGGVIIPPKGWLKALEAWAHKRGALFILDEIQSGMGRTGSLYRYQDEGLDPDMLLLGKGLGNGFHISALLTKDVPEEKYIHALTGGAGDDPLACCAACAVFENLLEKGLLEHIKNMSSLMEGKLRSIAEKYPALIRDIRCMGLACAVELSDREGFNKLMPLLRESGLLVSPSANNSFMLKPPYTVTADQIEEMSTILQRSISLLA